MWASFATTSIVETLLFRSPKFCQLMRIPKDQYDYQMTADEAIDSVKKSFIKEIKATPATKNDEKTEK